MLDDAPCDCEIFDVPDVLLGGTAADDVDVLAGLLVDVALRDVNACDAVAALVLWRTEEGGGAEESGAAASV